MKITALLLGLILCQLLLEAIWQALLFVETNERLWEFVLVSVYVMVGGTSIPNDALNRRSHKKWKYVRKRATAQSHFWYNNKIAISTDIYKYKHKKQYYWCFTCSKPWPSYWDKPSEIASLMVNGVCGINKNAVISSSHSVRIVFVVGKMKTE